MEFSPRAIARELDPTGVEVTPDHVETALDEIDHESHIRQAASRMRWEVWDKTSLINGVPPHRILSRPDYSGGEVYLIYIDNRLTFLQPHAPFEGGHVAITQETVSMIANEHVGVIAEGMAQQSIVEEVARRLAPKAALAKAAPSPSQRKAPRGRPKKKA